MTWRAIVFSLALFAHVVPAYPATGRDLEGTWGEARRIAANWAVGDVKLQLRPGGNIFVADEATILVGEEFLNGIESGGDGRDKLLFALLHELWHVHQVNRESHAYKIARRRPPLECEADARAAFELARRELVTASSNATLAEGEAIASKLTGILTIPLGFPAISDANAANFQHLGTDQRRFASLVGVLVALIADSRKLPENYSPGGYGRLQRQASEMYKLSPFGTSDKERMSEACAYISGSDAAKQVRVLALRSAIRQIDGKRILVTRYEIQNLMDWPIKYMYLLVDGVVDKSLSERNVTGFTSMRTGRVLLPARGKAEFETLEETPVIDSSTSKYLAGYSLGTLDVVTRAGDEVPRPACFDELSDEASAALDFSMKTAIRIGYAAQGRFEAVRGAEDNLYSNAYQKVFHLNFGDAARSAGSVYYMGFMNMAYVTLNVYEGLDKKDALKVIDRAAAFAERFCPASEDPAAPLFKRDPATGSLEIYRFTTGSRASLKLILPDERDPELKKFIAFWTITRDVIEK
jgi:hypothetical protein